MLARKTYGLRRKRAAIFGNPELFGEPAWDILLDLFIAQAEDKPVSVSSACIGSAAPATTGLRWLGVLADEGLIVRENDAGDNRRVLVRLSHTGVKAMERFLEAVEASL
ncbi:MAG: transcriptional regulator [Alphaproteobacteria bacterium HGW-Alphaproteobacteria-14]|nr:MAG: transcriptional regulator [Alphaproteobacteria bacterium HGW-Alphaproteobacteria-14]